MVAGALAASHCRVKSRLLQGPADIRNREVLYHTWSSNKPNHFLKFILSCFRSPQAQDGDKEELASLWKACWYIHQARVHILWYSNCTNQANFTWRGLYLHNGEKNSAGIRYGLLHTTTL